MPTKSSWSTNSTSICRRSRPHASPHRESSRTPQPPQCSGDLGKPALDPTHFFPRVEKVGLEPVSLVADRSCRSAIPGRRKRGHERVPTTDREVAWEPPNRVDVDLRHKHILAVAERLDDP